jgi:hypothetical protein
MKINIASLKMGLLFFLPYTAFLGVAALPTWRIVNILFVVVSVIFLKIRKQDQKPEVLTFMQALFFIYCTLQVMLIWADGRAGTYEVIFLFSLVILFAFCYFFYQLLSSSANLIVKTLFYSTAFLVVYQLYQQAVFQLGKWPLAVILNERGIYENATFFRVIGGVLGPAGFMAEAGHVALFVGPLLMILFLMDYYSLLKVDRRFLYLCLFSLVICLSGGAVIHILFAGIMLLIINFRKLNIQALSIIAASVVLFVAVLYALPAYQDVIVYRVTSIFTGDSERLRGAEVFLAKFSEAPWFGIAPKASRYMSADPNVFIPVMLADHGIIGFTFLMLMWFVPAIYAYKHSERKLFIIPFISLTVHLFLAYGTYTWSVIWINIVLILWCLSYKPTTPIPTQYQYESV